MKLSNGKEIEFDWTKVSQRDFRLLASQGTNNDHADEIIGKLIGMSAEELGDLNVIDHRSVAIAMWKSYEKMADQVSKNLVSASISE